MSTTSDWSTQAPGWLQLAPGTGSGFSPLDSSMKTAAQVIAIVVCLVGIPGNICTIVVILSRKEVKAHFGSLWVLLVSLAFTDLMTCLALIPIQVLRAGDYMGYDFLCQVIYSCYIFWAGGAASVWHLFMISVDRFLVMRDPISRGTRTETMFRESHRRFVRQKVGMILFIYAISYILIEGWTLFMYRVVDGQCIFDQERFAKVRILFGFTIYGFLNWIVPSVGMIGMYSYVVYKTYNSASPVMHHSVRNMLIVTMLAYEICWTPNQLIWLYSCLHPGQNVTAGFWYVASYSIVAVNSCVNPVIYTLKNKKFRENLLNMVSRNRLHPSLRTRRAFTQKEAPPQQLTSRASHDTTRDPSLPQNPSGTEC